MKPQTRTAAERMAHFGWTGDSVLALEIEDPEEQDQKSEEGSKPEPEPDQSPKTK